jgi:hypothetical protein
LGYGVDEVCLKLSDYLRLDMDDYKWSESLLLYRSRYLMKWDCEDCKLPDELRGISVRLWIYSGDSNNFNSLNKLNCCSDTSSAYYMIMSEARWWI